MHKTQNIESDIKPDESKKEFQLELYKFFLGEIKAANEDKHKYLTLYQTVALAIIGGGAYVYTSSSIDGLIKETFFKYLLGILDLFTVFVIILVVTTMRSWYKYREDEKKLLDKVFLSENNFRETPKLNFKKIFEWSETYLIAFLIFFALVLNILTFCLLLK